METCRAVEHLEVSGWVRNKRDGSVEAVFEGEAADVTKALNWCQQGPPISRVDDIQISWLEYTGEFIGFNITY
jgi:acylphosphatase